MTTSNHKEDWLLWQLSDSSLPTGGFVASSGLESAIHSSYVHDLASLSQFLSSSITNYAYSALPFVSDTYLVAEKDLGEHDCYEQLERLDGLYDACTSNNITKRASKAQGLAMLTLYSKSFAVEDDKWSNVVNKFKKEVLKKKVDGHFPVCFGLVARLVGLTLGEWGSNVKGYGFSNFEGSIYLLAPRYFHNRSYTTSLSLSLCTSNSFGCCSIEHCRTILFTENVDRLSGIC
jgi:urease accessory protein UreF